MKSKPSLNPIGLPFLDLLCCAFGGVLLLYIIDIDVPPPIQPSTSGGIGAIEVTLLDDTIVDLELAVRVSEGSHIFESWSGKGSASWSPKFDGISAIIPIKLNAPKVEVFIKSLGSVNLGKNIQIQVYSATKNYGQFQLLYSNGYRTSVE